MRHSDDVTSVLINNPTVTGQEDTERGRSCAFYRGVKEDFPVQGWGKVEEDIGEEESHVGNV
jgi:hypothetical protein